MSYHSLFSHKKYIASKSVVIFCNQSSYDFTSKKYLFDLIAEDGKLNRILMPEHGLFSEHQDQENIDDIYYKGIPCTSLYNKKTNITGPEAGMFKNADTLIIDIQDVGVRFFTFTTHMFILLHFVSQHLPDITVLVLDRQNPLGSKAEGTILDERYTSFLGVSGMIHRHGMSTGELCDWYLKRHDLSISIHKVSFTISSNLFISPSPNLPSYHSLQVYPGQCFWEATTFSEGRGTTRPFELIGHPNLTFDISEKIGQQFNKKYRGLAFIRSTYFMPVYHKHCNKICCGWHLFIEDFENYQTIKGTMDIMKWVREIFPENDFWRAGKYEFDSEATAAQILMGDDRLIGYIEGEINESEVTEIMLKEQQKWKSQNV